MRLPSSVNRRSPSRFDSGSLTGRRGAKPEVHESSPADIASSKAEQIRVKIAAHVETLLSVRLRLLNVAP